MTTNVNPISLSSQTIPLLDKHTIFSAYHGNYGRAKSFHPDFIVECKHTKNQVEQQKFTDILEKSVKWTPKKIN